MTSDHLELGLADADNAWMGIRPHQAALALVGLGLVGDALFTRRTLVELILGLVALGGAAPVGEGRSVAEVGATALRFLLRRHWDELTVREFGDDVMLWSRREVAVRGYRLAHLGRLDLSGRDVALAESLAVLVDAASAARGPRHLAQHVLYERGGPCTLLTLPPDLSPPDGWVLDARLVREVFDVAESGTGRFLERFSYVRTTRGLVRTFRVRDYSAVPSSRPLLEALLRARPGPGVAVHVDVVSGARASRVAARAVHKVDSDDATSRSVGFRRSATSQRRIDRLAQREVLVASGRALVRVAVFVVVRATSLTALNADSAAIWRHAHDAGLRLERGRGVQAAWYVAQLPGGATW